MSNVAPVRPGKRLCNLVRRLEDASCHRAGCRFHCWGILHLRNGEGTKTLGGDGGQDGTTYYSTLDLGAVRNKSENENENENENE